MAKNFKNLAENFGEEKDYQPYQGLPDDVLDAIADSGEMVEALPIMKIYPDVTQPRYILPSRIRSKWNGSPSAMPKLIEDWQREAFASIEKKPNYLRDMLEGQVQNIREPKDTQFGAADLPIVYRQFIALVDLAASIHETGLQQPVKVSRQGENYLLIMGERRWMAYQLLNMVFGTYDKIPAIISNLQGWERVVAQADENAQREDLTAIGKARQLSRLLIEAHGADKFDTYAKIVVNSDRPYFAQVANGNLWPIPRGMGAKFEKSMKCSGDMLRRYRAILAPFEDFEIDNAIWAKADDESWSEGAIRAILPDASWGADTREAYFAAIRKIIAANVWHYDQIADIRKNSASLVAKASAKWIGGETVRLTQSILGIGGQSTLSQGLQGLVVKNNHSNGSIWGVLFDNQKFVVVDRVVDGRTRSILDFCEIIEAPKPITKTPKAPSEITSTPEATPTPIQDEKPSEITRNYLTEPTETIPQTRKFEPPVLTDNQSAIADNATKYLGKKIRTKLNEICLVQGIQGSKHLKVLIIATGEKHQIYVEDVAEILSDEPLKEVFNPTSDTLIKVGSFVMTRINAIGEVKKINGNIAYVETNNGVGSHYIETLRRLTAEEETEYLGKLAAANLPIPAIDGESRELLAILNQLANFMGDSKGTRAVQELSALSAEECNEMSKSGTLHDVFAGYFNAIGTLLENTRITFGNELDSIEERLSIQND